MPSNVNPIAQGFLSDDPRFNERYAQVLGVGSSAGVYSGNGVPPASLGFNGDTYIRIDGGAGTFLYQKRAGAWVASAA